MPTPPASWELATPVYGIRYPRANAPAKFLPDAFQHIGTDLENALLAAAFPPGSQYKTGTHAERLAASPQRDLIWIETDTGLRYIGTGTAWIALDPSQDYDLYTYPITLLSGWERESGWGIPRAIWHKSTNRVELTGSVHRTQNAGSLRTYNVGTLPVDFAFTYPRGGPVATTMGNGIISIDPQTRTLTVLHPANVTLDTTSYVKLDGIQWRLQETS